MKNDQKGAASLIVIILLLLIVGGIWWAYDKSKAPTTTNPVNYSIGTQDTNSTSVTGSNDTTSSTALTPNNSAQVNDQPTVISGNSNVFPGGSEYRSPYGLTLALPASWQAYALSKNTTTFGGIAPEDSTTFRLASGPVLTINVFTKEQWNSIKTQENAANLNVNSLGEGEYLGENATYIYSYSIHDRESEVRQILGNIISF